jgi:predicted amidohydrolase
MKTTAQFLYTCLLGLTIVTPSINAQPLNLNKYQGQEQTMTQLRIASVSVLPEKWEKEKNWERTEKMVRTAAVEGGAQVVVTPEGVLEGYVINEVNQQEDTTTQMQKVDRFFALGEPIDGPYIKKAAQLSDELDIYLVFGFLERAGDQLFNSVILVDPDGEIVGHYYKTHFAQGYTINPNFYQPGNDYPVFDTPFGKVGMMICYDRQLPEPARILSLKGAQILFVPSYGSYSEEDGWNTVLMRTRAYENQVPLVFCNPYQSLLIDEDGDIRAMGNAGEIVYYEINTAKNRYEGRFKNRRPETYRDLIKEQEDPRE